MKARRCIAAARYKRRWLWIPGLRAGGAHPGMRRGEDVVPRCAGVAERPLPPRRWPALTGPRDAAETSAMAYFWLLIAIVVTGGVAAIVNDTAYGGALFDSSTVVGVAMLSALTLFVGRGMLRGTTTSQWLNHALIWAAIVLAVAVAYRLWPMLS
ncbi:hypothetical protein Rpal_4758 [Rhodopseudomonas palustris TIE-1]|nr:hypothetical protein Rpal_4758 [Rhodopseudomonas palustris TIE-1]